MRYILNTMISIQVKYMVWNMEKFKSKMSILETSPELPELKPL